MTDTFDLATLDLATLDEAALDRHYHEIVAQLRAIAPVVWVPCLNAWLVVAREAAVAAMRDAVTYTVDDPRFSTAQVVGTSMLSLDGAEHRRHREPFASHFRPADVVRRDTSRIERAARRLVEDLSPRGTAELRRELAGPLAVAVAAGGIGLEGVPVDELLGWYDRLVAAVGEVSQGKPVTDDARRAHASLAAELLRTLDQPGSWVAAATSNLTTEEAVANAAGIVGVVLDVDHGAVIARRPGSGDGVAGAGPLADDAVEAVPHLDRKGLLHHRAGWLRLGTAAGRDQGAGNQGRDEGTH